MGAGASSSPIDKKGGGSTAENKDDTELDNTAFSTAKENLSSYDLFAALPEKATQKELSEVVGEEASKRLMRSFSIDGLIDKESTRKIVTQTVDSEVYNLFMNYTTNYVMNEERFIEMLKDCKILSKQDLSTHYAKLLYKEETSRFEDSSSEVNFAAFRNHLLPIVAEKKNMTIDQLLKRLAHFEEAAHPDLYSHLEPPPKPIPVSASPITTTSENSKAAIRLQSMSRRQASQKRLVMKRQLSRAASVEVTSPPPRACFTNPDTGQSYTEEEITHILSRSFETYISCNPSVVQIRGQMNRHQFVHLCYDAGLVTTALSVKDIQQVFDEALAIASNPSTGKIYNEGVFYNKRINFYVFRTILFNLLVNKTELDIDVLFVKLTNGLPDKPSEFKQKKEKAAGGRRHSNVKLFVDLNAMFADPSSN